MQTTTAATPPSGGAPPSSAVPGGAPPKGPPKALPVILFFFLPIFFSVCFAPLLASTTNPQIQNLNIVVASFDTNNALSTAFMNTFTAVAQQNLPTVPSLDLVQGSSSSPAALYGDVSGINAWGAIWLNANAFDNMVAALYNPTQPYDPSSAITFVFNEGRSQIYPFVTMPATAILQGFTAAVASTLNQQIANGTFPGLNLTNIAMAKPNLLVQPVGYSVQVVEPSSWLPLAFTSLTLGNILMAVFALAITNVVLGPLTPFLIKGRSPVQGTAMRIFAILIFGGVIPLALSSIMTGLGSLSADVFFRTWAIFWLEILGFIFYFCFFATMAGTPAVVPLFLLPLICYNSIGGWNTDLAPSGYYFFRYAPFYQTTILMRNVLFKAYPGRQGIHIAVLFAWLFLAFIPFCIASVFKLKKMQQAMKAAALKAANDAAVASKTSSAAAAPTLSLPSPQPAQTSSEQSVSAVSEESILASKGYSAVPASLGGSGSPTAALANPFAATNVSSPVADVASPATVAVEMAAVAPAATRPPK